MHKLKCLECGEVTEKTLKNQIHNNHPCQKCHKIRKIKEYKRKLEQTGFALAEEFRGDVNKKHWIECLECGDEQSKVLQSQFRNGFDCPECKRIRKGKEYNNKLKKTGFELEEEFKGNIKKKHLMRCCECGERYNKQIQDQLNNDHDCPSCQRRKRGKEYQNKIEGFELDELFKGSIEKKHTLRCEECDNSFERFLKSQIYESPECPYCREKRVEKEVKQNLRETGFKLVGNYQSSSLKHKIECLECGEVVERRVEQQVFKEVHCPSCTNYQRSEAEEELASFIENQAIDIQRNATPFIDTNMELDVYIPQYDLAIEHHGLYWHSEVFKDKDYHTNKLKKCRSKGIRLIQFFSDQWRDRKGICKSMILHALNETPNTIYARECTVERLKEGYEGFFEENHVEGNSQARFAWALKYQGEIVSALSIRKSRYYDAQEIARFASKKFHHIPGALSRLLSYVEQDDLISYVDLMHGNGKGYLSNGFSEAKETIPRYWYTDFESRIPRQEVQATQDLTERQLAFKKGLHRIYGVPNKLLKS